MPEVDADIVADALRHRYWELLWMTFDEPRHLPAVLEEVDIPHATAYRVVNELCDAGLLELDHKEPMSEGAPRRYFVRTTDSIVLEADGRELTARITPRLDVDVRDAVDSYDDSP